MADATLEDVLRDNHAAILAAVSVRMRGDEDMARVAEHRGLSEGDLTGEVLGFWLQGIRSDLALGGTAAMEQNMQWLLRFREGHSLPFADSTVRRCFAEISEEIERKLDTYEQRKQYAAYRAEVERIILDTFPAENGGSDASR